MQHSELVMMRRVFVALLVATAASASMASDVRTLRRADGVLLIYNEHSSSATQRVIASGAELSAVIDQLARRQNLDPRLVQAVIQVESGFDRHALSSKGAQGLMQLMPATALELGVRNAFDVVQNVRGGTEYLRRMIDRFGGSLELGLASYNAGPAAVARFGGLPPYRETARYVRRVLDAYERGPASAFVRREHRPVRVEMTAKNEILITTAAADSAK